MGSNPPDAPLSAANVRDVVFHSAFRGYRERDVDAFLDRVYARMVELERENDRLRAEAPPAHSPWPPPAPAG